jgi:hypothetical protein
MPPPAQYAANRLKAIENRAIESDSRSILNAGRDTRTARVIVLPTQDLAAYR